QLDPSTTVTQSAQGVIEIPGDRDVFRVQLDLDQVYQISAEGFASRVGTLPDSFLRVFDSKGRLVGFNDDGAAGTDAGLFFVPKASGTYYVEVSSNSDSHTGTYAVRVVPRALPPDEAADTVATQASIAPGESIKASLLTQGDEDWFSIDLVAGKDYVFRAQGAASGMGSLLDPVLGLYSADGSPIASHDNSLISTDAFLVYRPVVSGRFYLAVKAADPDADSGSYTLTARAPDDHSDTLQRASLIDKGAPLVGAIQWASGAFGTRAVDALGIASDIDIDWFRFEAAAGEVLSFNAVPDANSTLSRLMVEIIGGGVERRTYALADGLETADGSAVATFRADNGGTYYARLIDGAGATGAYSVTLSAGDASDEDSMGVVALAMPPGVDSRSIAHAARIGLPADVDEFEFGVKSGGSYRIEVLTLRDGVHAPITGADLAAVFMSSTADETIDIENVVHLRSPSSFETAIFEAPVDGRVRVRIAAQGNLEAGNSAINLETGQYQLRITRFGALGADDRPDQVSTYSLETHGVLAVDTSQAFEIGSFSDRDLFAVSLTEGNVHQFRLLGASDNLGTLTEAALTLLDSDGYLVSRGRLDVESGRTLLDVSVFESGLYYLGVSAIGGLPGSLGSYVVENRKIELGGGAADAVPADTFSTARVGPGRPFESRIDTAGDLDWVGATLESGKRYVIDLLGDGDGAGGTLSDGQLRLIDSHGSVVAVDEDSGASRDARLIVSIAETGQYFIEAAGTGSATGTYTLRVRELYSGEADPLKAEQWVLPALGLDRLDGSISGAGVLIGMIDDGVDTAHPDLQAQLDFSKAYDAAYKSADGRHKIPYPTVPDGDYHGTPVAGIMVAEANNETGIVGIAPDAELASVRVKWQWGHMIDALGKQYQFDVSNNSWGVMAPFVDSFNSTTVVFAHEAIRRAVEDGRQGLGTVMVFGAGNSNTFGANTNYSNFANAREVITVGATERDGSPAGFSTPGANVLVGAFGTGVLSTDRSEPGLGMNTVGNYTMFSGTSAAAPVVSGVVALMLEANPGLGYRDVQEILALSARRLDNQDWKQNGAVHLNGGGLAYNDQLGFGLVDAWAAVQLAQTWGRTSTANNEVVTADRSFGLRDAIPDGTGAYERVFSLEGNVRVGHIELSVDLRHSRLGDLTIEVISPSGTVSALMNRPTVNAEQPFGQSGIDSGVPTHLLWDFSSVQFMGEKAAGDWTVRVRDVRAEETGQIASLSLRAYGWRDSGDDILVFGDAGFGAQAVGRTIADEGGIDQLNAAMTSVDLLIDLSEGMLIGGGTEYPFADWTMIEHAVGGEGYDRIIGSAVANHLSGQAGDDIFVASAGNDTIEGGVGFDTVTYSGTAAGYRVSYDPFERAITVADVNPNDGDLGFDVLTSVERLVFADQEVAVQSVSGGRAPVINRSFFDKPIEVDKGDDLIFELPPDIIFDPDDIEPIAPVPPGDAEPDDPVQMGEEGEILFGLIYLDAYRAAKGRSIAEVQLTLTPEADPDQLVHVFEKILINDQSVDASMLLLELKSTKGMRAIYEIRLSEAGTQQFPEIDSIDFALKFDLADVVYEATKVDLVSSEFGIANVLDRKPSTLASLRIEASGEQGESLPEWLTFDEESKTFRGTPPDDFQGQVKVLLKAFDDQDQSAEGVLTFQWGDNQAPVVQAAYSMEIVEDHAEPISLGLVGPVDPEGTSVTVKVIELPIWGRVLRPNGDALAMGVEVSADEIEQWVYESEPDRNGDAGYVRYSATDEDGVTATSSVRVFVAPVNDAPRFAPDGGIVVRVSDGSTSIELAQPFDPESTIETVSVVELPLLGEVTHDSKRIEIGDSLNVSDLRSLRYSLNENVNGPVGRVVIRAIDPQGLSSDWSLSIESQGDRTTSSGTSGPDALYGSIANDILYGLAGNDSLFGNAGDDRLVGGAGGDLLFGGTGSDYLDGGSGEDTLDGGAGADVMAGGPGNDQYLVDDSGDVVVEVLSKGAGGID
ncbi:MAG: hypothetical protein RL322_2290, partial [Pseudomonadota bacterium]